MVRDLDNAVVTVRWEAGRTDGIACAVQAKKIALILIRFSMNGAMSEESGT